MGGAPGFHNGSHEEDEQIRPKQVSLLDPDYGVHYRRGAIDIKLDFDCRVQGLQEGHQLGGDPLFKHDFPQEFSWHSVEGFDKVDEEQPSFKTVFAALLDELFHGENVVHTASKPSKTVLPFMIEIEAFLDWFEPHKQNVAKNLVGHFQHYDAAVVPWITEVPLFGKDAQKSGVPFLRRGFCNPEMPHKVSDEAHSSLC